MPSTGETSSEENCTYSRHGSPRLRSEPARVHSFIRFLNASDRCVNVLWVNYEGTLQDYGSISPGSFLDMNTYVGHPWIALDNRTGDRLVLDGKTVHSPVAYNLTDGWPPTRAEVKITIPVFSLMDRCFQVLRDSGRDADVLSRSDVPHVIKDGIRYVMDQTQRRTSQMR